MPELQTPCKAGLNRLLREGRCARRAETSGSSGLNYYSISFASRHLRMPKRRNALPSRLPAPDCAVVDEPLTAKLRGGASNGPRGRHRLISKDMRVHFRSQREESCLCFRIYKHAKQGGLLLQLMKPCLTLFPPLGDLQMYTCQKLAPKLLLLHACACTITASGKGDFARLVIGSQ